VTKKKVIVMVVAALLAGALARAYVQQVTLPKRGLEKSAAAAGMPRHAVIAHRGASYLAPEETAPAYVLARDMGADLLEGDIQRTQDGVLVLLHSHAVGETTNAAQLFPGRANDPVDSFTLAELKRLDAGSWFNAAHPRRARAAYAGLKILTLDELITLAESGTANRPALYLETKSPERFPGIERDLVELLRRRGWLGTFPGPERRAKVIFQSFRPESLARLRELAPEVPRVRLFGSKLFDRAAWDAMTREIAGGGAQGVGPTAYLCWPWNVSTAHRAGLLVHPYTVNARWQFRILALLGADDGCFTDRCDQSLRFYGRPLLEQPEAILVRNGY